MEIRKNTDLRISDDVLFSEACSCYRGEMAGKSKEIDSSPSSAKIEPPQKPTEKQIKFLNEHKVKIPITRKEATNLIKTYIDNQKNI